MIFATSGIVIMGTFTTNELLILIITIVNTAIVVVTARYYYKYRITEYLLFGMGYLFSVYYGFYNIGFKLLDPDFEVIWMDNFEIIPPPANLFLSVVHFLGGITVQAAITCWNIYFARSLWLKPPKKIWLILFTGMTLNIFAFGTILNYEYIYFGLDPHQAYLVRIWIYFLPFLFFGYLVFRTLLISDKIVIRDTRVLKGAKIWRFVYLIVIIQIIFRIIHVLFITSNYEFLVEYVYTFRILISLTSAVAFTMMAMICVFYPEAFLIFESHLLRLKPLYLKIMGSKISEDSKSKISKDRIIDYISNIPSNFYTSSQETT